MPHDEKEVILPEWGTGHEPDPNELVDFLTDDVCTKRPIEVGDPHPVPLHEPEEGLLDEEILPLWKDWLRGPCVQPCG